MPTTSSDPANADRDFSPRNRLAYLALVIATIALGLATRRFGAIIPLFVHRYAPDALWALMVFWIVGMLFARAKTTPVAIIALAFSYGIEISQLYHAPWIDNVRHTTLGGLILGFGFLWSDIVCYTVGVTVGVLLERSLLRKHQP